MGGAHLDADRLPAGTGVQRGGVRAEGLRQGDRRTAVQEPVRLCVPRDGHGGDHSVGTGLDELDAEALDERAAAHPAELGEDGAVAAGGPAPGRRDAVVVAHGG
jgi:hypothetical protein